MLKIYQWLTSKSAPVFSSLLQKRMQKGKEDAQRLDERKGIAGKQRPDGPLVWIHAASVGEAQSALILVDKILQLNADLYILITTGTRTSAKLLETKLPDRALHQFYPLDHPEWVERFLDHWQPGLVLWMESELWPNMLDAIKRKNIPAALINARLSKKSFRRWHFFRKSAAHILSVFNLILTQTVSDAHNYKLLGARNILATGNLKYGAKPLPANEEDLKTLTALTAGRPLWLSASTHKGEEEMACRVHDILKSVLPDILTIIVPRHPERAEEILTACAPYKLNMTVRGEEKKPPAESTDIYLANTMGELGLFYRLAPVACIGRSFSDDGGGGHNPIEAAQLNCAVLYGPHVQYQEEIYAEMGENEAAIQIKNENNLGSILKELLTTPQKLSAVQNKGRSFVNAKKDIAEETIKALKPLLIKSGLLDLYESRKDEV